MLAVGGFQQLYTHVVLGQQTLLDDFSDIGAGEFEAVGKPGLNFGKVVALLLAHVTEYGVHVFLCGDDDPGAALAFGGQAFSHRLQVGHQLGVFSNVLANLINEEIEPEIGRLGVQPCFDLVSKVFDGNAVLGAVFVEDALRQNRIFSCNFSVSAGNVARLQQGLLPTAFPGLARMVLVGGFEGFKLATTVEVPLELGDIPLLAEIATHLVKDFNEHRQQSIDLALADDVGLLVDVEQDAL